MDVGLCDPAFALQEGDDVIILVDCYSANQACETAQPLRLSGVPPRVAPGQTVTVRVDEYGVEDPNALPTTTISGPAAGVTVSNGERERHDGCGRHGAADVPRRRPGPVTATKPDRVRTAGVTCVTSGSDGNCGTQVPPGTPLGTEDPDDKTAPVASFSGLRTGKVFSRRKAPRELKGSVTADPSGLKSVRLGIRRKLGDRCWTFDGGVGALRAPPLRRLVVVPDRRPRRVVLPAAEAAAPRALHHQGGRDRQGRQQLRHRDDDPGPVRRAALILAGAVLAAPAAAEARGKVDVMVVGRSAVLVPAERVALKARTAAVGGRRCSIGRATPLSALAGTGVAFSLRDYGACSRRARDAGSLYVRKIGPDRERGSDGWVYKVGRRSGSGGAADPAGPFGTGRRLRDGQQVLWFWCVKDAADQCQRTLETSSAATVAPGAPLAVTVRGYDEQGKGVPVAGATVTLGGASATTGADGVATVVAPAAGRHALEAAKPGLVRSFPRRIGVG